MNDRRVPSAGSPPAALILAFAPLDKAVFGVAVGVAAALLVAGMTALTLLQPPDQQLPLGLLKVYFRGYTVSGAGVFVGAAWAGFVGFIFGWFMAFCRNLTMAISLLIIRSRAEMAQTRDFLDHV